MKVRALFLSDIHLGSPWCQAELLLEFLDRCQAQRIYLVGDIIDGWRLTSRWYWPRSHDDVLETLLARARSGARVLYVTGNHDAFLRGSPGAPFEGVELVDSTIHEAADGRRYLVVHGDRFDLVVTYVRWLALIGDAAYEVALAANASLNRARLRRGLAYWPLSAWAKLKFKEVVNFISNFEAAVAAEARRLDVHGVICGHIHHAAMHDEFGVRYINVGDWVESCTAVVEHFDGRFEVVRWTERLRAEAGRRGAERREDRRARLIGADSLEPHAAASRPVFGERDGREGPPLSDAASGASSAVFLSTLLYARERVGSPEGRGRRSFLSPRFLGRAEILSLLRPLFGRLRGTAPQ